MKNAQLKNINLTFPLWGRMFETEKDRIARNKPQSNLPLIFMFGFIILPAIGILITELTTDQLIYRTITGETPSEKR